MYDTSVVGAIAEQKFVLRCLSKGLIPNKPVVEHFPDYDYIVFLNGSFARIQVKTFRIREVGNYKGLACGNLGKYSGRDAYDYIAVVCHELDTMWLLPADHIADRQSISIRMEDLSDWDQYIF